MNKKNEQTGKLNSFEDRRAHINEQERLSVTRKQIELAFYIRQYRRIHQLSQTQMANICTLYGKPHNVKFAVSEISEYENYKHMPTPPKFQILMNTMDLDPDVL